MLKPQLPPLEPLIAFEAAARLLSFTQAAQELNLTQAAVSQRIRALEDRIGVSLFTRAHRSVSLTPAGREYQHTVSTVLKHLASATSDIRSESIKPRVNIAADQSVAALWLMPRLVRFQFRHPNISVRLIASDADEECTAEDISIAILHGTGEWPGFTAELLFPEEVFPVCSPQYAHKTESVEQLVLHTLIDLEDVHWDWMNWRIWLNRNNVDLPTEHRRLQVNNYPLLIDAAKNGLGMALGWRCLVDDAITSGELIIPVENIVTTEFGYYLLRRERDKELPEVSLFYNWVKSQFR